MLSFSFIYVDSLKQQNKTFETIECHVRAVQFTACFSGKYELLILIGFISPPIYENSALVYPMISSLIMPNTISPGIMTM